MKKYVKITASTFICTYLLICVASYFSYDYFIENIGNSNIIYRNSEVPNYIVYLEDESVNIVKIKDVSLDVWGFSKIPRVEKKNII